ncbi:MAG: AraC family transcriptional regulator [Bacteroidales bacterium]|nr:AraC family transcriptional regulator [Bacteroidales bacterium]
MKKLLHILIFALVAVMAACTGGGGVSDNGERNRDAQSADTIHTIRAAMSIYGYQPEQALQIIDSALIVGNIDEVQAEQCRARIYGMTLMHEQMDSLLGGPTDIRLDSAQAIAMRLLTNNTIKASLTRLRDVYEILAYTERMQNDTMGWLYRSRQLVDVCRQIGPEAETDALRTEAEIGAALYAMGHEEEGMAKVDSVLAILSDKGRFNELDAFIVASRRKIVMLGSHNRYAETLPLARRIIERLDDYEANPEKYHDGSHREPKTDQRRIDYIRFYRSQAQNFIAAAYASLGEQGNMLSAFRQIEDVVREATAREHIARYNALQQQMEAERQRDAAQRAKESRRVIGLVSLLIFLLTIYVFWQWRKTNKQNRILAQQIRDAVEYKEKYRELSTQNSQLQNNSKLYTLNSTLSDAELSAYLSDLIETEKLYLNPLFERQTLIDLTGLSKERIGAAFSHGSEYKRITTLVCELRLIHAVRLMDEHPEMSLEQVCLASGFSNTVSFRRSFKTRYGISPSEFRETKE